MGPKNKVWLCYNDHRLRFTTVIICSPLSVSIHSVLTSFGCCRCVSQASLFMHMSSPVAQPDSWLATVTARARETYSTVFAQTDTSVRPRKDSATDIRMPRGTPPKRRSSNAGILGKGRPSSGPLFRPQDLLRIRTIALLTLVCLALYTILKSLGGTGIAREPFHVIDHFSSKIGTRVAAVPATPRIKKLSAVMGDRNDIYEAALRTHERQNAIHGYDMEILRERIIGSYWEKPAYILSKIIEELAKPAAVRNHWLM